MQGIATGARKTMKYTAGEAAKATGVSTATISRAIKNGKISALKGDSGAWQIDPSELHRVYPPIAAQANASVAVQEVVTPPQTDLLLQIGTLQERLRAEEAARSEAQEERDRWRDQAERLARALPAPEASHAERRPSLIARFLGRS